MGEKDIIQKTLEGCNDVFADIFNVLLFNGKEVIKEQDLSDATPYSMFKAEGKVHEQERDVAKYHKGSIFQLALFGIENQSCVDNTMPLRVFSYDGAAYKHQLRNQQKGKKHFYPVITIVLYFGKGRWTGPTKLSEIVEIPEEYKPYVNDFRIHVFPVAYIPKKKRDMFKSDFKQIADFFYQNERNKEFKPTDEEIKHIEEFLQLMKIFSNDKKFKDIYNDYRINKDSWIREGGNNMCYVVDQFVNKGIKQGKAETTEAIVLKMLEDNVPDANIKQYTGVTSKELKAIKAKLVVVAQ